MAMMLVYLTVENSESDILNRDMKFSCINEAFNREVAPHLDIQSAPCCKPQRPVLFERSDGRRVGYCRTYHLAIETRWTHPFG